MSPGLHDKVMKKSNPLSKRDKNQKKSAKASKEATQLTKANQLGPRSKVAKKAVRAALPRGPADRGKTLQVPGVKKSVLHEAVLAWARGLENPFTGTPQKCPFNFNPVPSYLSFVATTVSGRFGADAVASNGTVQLTFWPGHAALNADYAVDPAATVENVVYDFDEVAYHHPFVKCGGDGQPVNVGPVNFVDVTGTTRFPTGYVKTGTLAIGTATNDFSGAGSVSVGWNAGLPISGDVRLEGHLRYKLLSMGIRIINTTPELSRGGDIVSVQPATVRDILTPQASNSIDPSFKAWGPEGCTISWIPRLRDLAYWHPTSGGVLTSGVATGPIITNSGTGAGVVVWINNPTAAAQTFDTEVVCHWEISGYSVQTLAGEGKSTFVPDSVLKGALSAQTNTQATASGFSTTIRAAAGEIVHLGEQAVSKAIQLAPRAAMNALH